MNRITSPRLNRNDDPELQERPTVAELQQRFQEQADQLMAYALDPREEGQQQERTFYAFELALIPMVFALGRTLVMLFLAAAGEREDQRTPERMRHDGRRFQKREAKGRNLQCWFGVVRYWRTYMGLSEFHPSAFAPAVIQTRSEAMDKCAVVFAHRVIPLACTVEPVPTPRGGPQGS